MTGTAYRVCVERLERLLSPRVVSRTLRMEMQPAGLSPDTVTAADLEPILKGAVFRQLQAVMSAEQAREAVQDVLGDVQRRQRQGPAGAGDEADPGGDEGAPEARPPSGEDDSRDPATHTGHEASGGDEFALAQLASLREALRPFNLYFEWPEVRRLRAQLAQLEEEIRAGGDGSDVILEAEDQLSVVASKLEDMLFLQAKDLAELDEAVAEVQGLGGAKVRRLDALVKHVHEAQANRQLAGAEIERARKVARDLRKLMASSVYASNDAEAPSEAEIDARLKALDLEGEVEDLAALERQYAVLLEHREDLADGLRSGREELLAGRGLGAALAKLRDDLGEADIHRRGEVERELMDAAQTLNRLPAATTAELARELDVLQGVLENGLPPHTELVRFRDRLALAVERAERAGRSAEEEAREARIRLDAQGERLGRARDDLLRHDDDAHDPLLVRIREGIERLRAAQAEERLDPEADAELREATAALAARQDTDDREGAHGHEQVRSLLARLDGFPTWIDPEGSAQLRRDLESLPSRPPGEDELAAGAAAVAAFVARVRGDARTRLDRAGAEAARWALHDVLGEIQAANERLEDDRDPELGALERRLEEAREEARAHQLERLHGVEREAERLAGIDDADEERLQAVLARGRAQIARGEPVVALAEATDLVVRLERTLERRIADVMPRLDAAMSAFRRVERLNSDDVATVRRILLHLDAQRAAFGKISPGMRARLERSLHEAEDLLGSLEEEERATRAIADRLMSGNHFDDLLGLFGPPSGPGGMTSTASSAHADGPGPQDGDPPPRSGGASGADTAVAWVEARTRARGTVAAALLDRGQGATAARGLPPGAESGWSDATRHLLGEFERIGASLDLGRLRLATVERTSGALLLATHEAAAALLVADDPATLGLLARDLRDDGGWRRALVGSQDGAPAVAEREAAADLAAGTDDDDRGPS